MKYRSAGQSQNKTIIRRAKESEQLVRKYDYKNLTLGDIFAASSEHLGGLEDGRSTKMYYQKFIFIEQVCFVFNLMGLGLSVIQYDLEFEESHEDISIWLLWLIFVSTCLLVVLTIYRYEAYIQWLKVRKQLSPDQRIWSTNEFWPMMIEIAIYCVIPLPFTYQMKVPFYNSIQGSEAYYHVNEILALIMISRTFYMFRTAFALTFWYNNRTQRVCNLYACEGNFMFVAKSLMRTAPYTSQFIAMMSIILIFGYGVRVCEQPLSRNDTTSNNLGLYSNALWNIIITITTVGYGDFYVRTDLGRFVIFIVCVLGIFVVSMMVVTLIESLKTTTLESHAIAVLERVRLREMLQQEAASVIKLMAKTNLGWKNGTLTKKQHHSLIVRLKQKLIEFKLIHRRYKSQQDNGSLNEEITNAFSLLKSDFTDLFDRQKLLLQTNAEIMAKLGIDAKIVPSMSQV